MSVDPWRWNGEEAPGCLVIPSPLCEVSFFDRAKARTRSTHHAPKTPAGRPPKASPRMRQRSPGKGKKSPLRLKEHTPSSPTRDPQHAEKRIGLARGVTHDSSESNFPKSPLTKLAFQALGCGDGSEGPHAHPAAKPTGHEADSETEEDSQDPFSAKTKVLADVGQELDGGRVDPRPATKSMDQETDSETEEDSQPIIFKKQTPALTEQEPGNDAVDDCSANGCLSVDNQTFNAYVDTLQDLLDTLKGYQQCHAAALRRCEETKKSLEDEQQRCADLTKQVVELEAELSSSEHRAKEFRANLARLMANQD
ncbi:hypothetical protein BDN70DRAFT_901052 [Pholiota conissans]|uniref:Uncharacterized protein n=1 Tax=Pholiota conissans TaxID=109636 RepID=A0A9P6CT63_9AGAR|nr:hypothetical protein BDN70DRAFT_901052 [Pholiota conissans]